MYKYIDGDFVIALVGETIKMYEDKIDSAPEEVRDNIQMKIDAGIASGHLDCDATQFGVEQMMAGLALIDLGHKIMENSHSMLVNPNVVKTITRQGDTILIEERDLTDAEISANAEMGLSDLEKFISNVNRTKE